MELLSISGASRDSGCSHDTLRRYVDKGLIPCIRLENGTRLFTPAAVAKAKKIKAVNMTRLGVRAG